MNNEKKEALQMIEAMQNARLIVVSRDPETNRLKTKAYNYNMLTGETYD